MSEYFGHRPQVTRGIPRYNQKKPKIGLGDLLESLLRRFGVEKVVKHVEKKTGVDCGCGRRKKKLNKIRL